MVPVRLVSSPVPAALGRTLNKLTDQKTPWITFKGAKGGRVWIITRPTEEELQAEEIT